MSRLHPPLKTCLMSLLPHDLLCLVEDFLVWNNALAFCIQDESKGKDNPDRAHFALFRDAYWIDTCIEYPMYELFTELDCNRVNLGKVISKTLQRPLKLTTRFLGYFKDISHEQPQQQQSSRISCFVSFIEVVF